MTAKSRPAPRSTTAIRRDEEVQKALAEAAPGAEETAPVRRKRDLLGDGMGGGGVALAGALYLLVELRVFSVTGGSFSLVQRIALAAMIVCGALFAEQAIERFGVRRLDSTVSRYNLTRVLRLLTALAAVGAFGVVVLGNLYKGLVSLGVISIIVGLAVQTPMTSFIGWLYILLRAPYRVGDRIQVGDATDLEFIATTMLEVAESEIGEEMQERVRVYRNLLAKTPVDELTVQEKPVVLFRSSENTWLEAILRYLVDPKRAGRVKTSLL